MIILQRNQYRRKCPKDQIKDATGLSTITDSVHILVKHDSNYFGGHLKVCINSHFSDNSLEEKILSFQEIQKTMQN